MAKQDAIKAAGLEPVLYSWLDSGFSYSEICERFSKEYGITTYPASISRLKFERELSKKQERQKERRAGAGMETTTPGKEKKRKFDAEAVNNLNNPPDDKQGEPPPINDKTPRERLLNSYAIAAYMLEKGIIEAAGGVSPMPLKQAAMLEKIANIILKHGGVDMVQYAQDFADSNKGNFFKLQ